MIISRNSLIRLILYIGILIFYSNINNYVLHHFQYILGHKVFCPALGSSENCDLGLLIAQVGMITGNVLMGLVILKSTQKLRYNTMLGRIEHLVCAVQALAQLWFAWYFFCMSILATSTEDIRITFFVSYFLLTALFFAMNGLLSFLDQINKQRNRQ